MRRKNEHFSDDTDRVVKDIRHQTRRRFSSEENILIVLSGLRAGTVLREPCRQLSRLHSHCISQIADQEFVNMT